MKKIIIKKSVNLYIEKDVKFYHCDFCGEMDTVGFESEFDDDDKGFGSINMQICYGCIKQLSRLLPK